MARIPKEVEQVVDDAIGEKPSRKKKTDPMYKIAGGSKIPVSKATGSLWKSRRDAALKYNDNLFKAWDEAIRYYEHDQSDHREDFGDDTVGNLSGARTLNDNLTETENVVFANTTTMVPALYSRNPQVEVTVEDDSKKRLAACGEAVVNTLFSKKVSPGIAIKSKAKRCIVTALLTNRAWLKLSWTHRADSSEQAQEDLIKLAEALEKAKSQKEIEEIEGRIIALEEAIDVLQPSGPSCVFKHPRDVLIDPNAQEPDGSDGNWIMDAEYLPTSYIIARYGRKKKDSDEYESIYQPTHTLRVKKEDVEEGDFSLFNDGQDYKQAGFDDQESYEKAKITKVWFVWDKVTRRVLMFNEKDWKWPIWVWDDPLKLDRFFPHHGLSYYKSPCGQRTKGEVTYYLDQQDAINEMSSEERTARLWARRNLFFNRNVVKKEDVERILKGPDGTAVGLDLPVEMDGRTAVWSITPPSLQYKELFDKESKYRAIDRISSVQEVLRGAQFKANTTNDAVNANVSAANMRLDEKSDEIEDWLGDIGWSMLQLCLQNMDKDTVAMLVGPKIAEPWEQLTPDEIRRSFTVQVVGGSTKKPTSQAKKQEALELGQVLGQFVNSAPQVVLRIMLEVMQEAFDEVHLDDSDWEEIKQAVMQKVAAPTAPAGPTGPAPNGGGRPATTQQQGQAQAAGQANPIDALLSKLPPELKQQIALVLQSQSQGQLM